MAIEDHSAVMLIGFIIVLVIGLAAVLVFGNSQRSELTGAVISESLCQSSDDGITCGDAFFPVPENDSCAADLTLVCTNTCFLEAVLADTKKPTACPELCTNVCVPNELAGKL